VQQAFARDVAEVFAQAIYLLEFWHEKKMEIS
jgi:hypothetical protein